MKLAVDLHVHTCLSPCADEYMTPNNIVNMAELKGLDVIAITDHNTALNVEPVQTVAKVNGNRLLVIPGMEVEASEEVHIVCFFQDIMNLKEFGKKVYEALLPVDNQPTFFGNQNIMNVKDEVVGEERRMLAQATSFNIAEVMELAKQHGGIALPAHIDREAYGLEGQLGFIPKEYDFKAVEVTKRAKQAGLHEGVYRTYFSSDAHDLGALLERDMLIEVEEKSIKAVLNWLECK